MINKTIRPPKIFSGHLLINDESDFWPKSWIIHENKLDLSDITFVIPVSYDHEDRMSNLKIILRFLNSFNTNVIVGEQGGKKFNKLNGDYKYVNFPYKEFHRTRMINRMTRLSNTDYVVNYDADILLSPIQLWRMAKKLRGGVDFVYPYDGGFLRVGDGTYGRSEDLVKKMGTDIGMMAGMKFIGENDKSVGGVIGYNKKSFMNAGMENENFVAYTPEDVERFERFTALGYKVERVDGALYHINHFVGEKSTTSNPYYQKGVEELNKIRSYIK
jgi:predicted glycosyltransferase involved in capsule biosynthesis